MTSASHEKQVIHGSQEVSEKSGHQKTEAGYRGSTLIIIIVIDCSFALSLVNSIKNTNLIYFVHYVAYWLPALLECSSFVIAGTSKV